MFLLIIGFIFSIFSYLLYRFNIHILKLFLVDIVIYQKIILFALSFIILYFSFIHFKLVFLFLIQASVLCLFFDFLLKFVKGYYIYGFIFSAVISLILVIYGYYNMNSIYFREFEIVSEKVSRPYKLLLISDTHYGNVQRSGVLSSAIDEINKNDFDFVILAGDIVDESTSKEKLAEVFGELGRINNKNGIYYVTGNHDTLSFGRNSHFTISDIRNELHKNDIIFADENSFDISDEITIIGRKDKSLGTRKSLSEYGDLNDYVIVIDHQPPKKTDDISDADLVLSGHTHAGQIFPFKIFISMVNDYVSGLYKKDDTNIIVSSGFAGWNIPVRTHEHSEYVIIDIVPKK